MSRVQLALNVDDLDAAVDFYSTLFDTPPAKREPGYANFAVADPPLKLVLFEGAGEPGSLNHLGVEVESTDEVQAADLHLRDAGLATTTQEATTCCYAVQDKTWVTDPAGRSWEIYTVLEDAPGGTVLEDAPGGTVAERVPVELSGGLCCGPGASSCC